MYKTSVRGVVSLYFGYSYDIIVRSKQTEDSKLLSQCQSRIEVCVTWVIYDRNPAFTSKSTQKQGVTTTSKTEPFYNPNPNSSFELRLSIAFISQGHIFQSRDFNFSINSKIVIFPSLGQFLFEGTLIFKKCQHGVFKKFCADLSAKKTHKPEEWW